MALGGKGTEGEGTEELSGLAKLALWTSQANAEATRRGLPQSKPNRTLAPHVLSDTDTATHYISAGGGLSVLPRPGYFANQARAEASHAALIASRPAPKRRGV